MIPKPIKIILIEDNPDYREALEFGMSRMDDLFLMAKYGTAEQALRALQRDVELSMANVVLLDLHLPKLSGIDAIDWIHTYVPNLKVLILTQSDDKKDVLEALKRGAAGYLLKSSSFSQIRDGIRQALTGGKPLDSQITGHVIDQMEVKERFSPEEVHPTPREVEILELLATGMIKKEIADHLQISQHTVNTHIRRVYDKFNVINAPAVVAKAYEMGILPRSK